MEEFRVMANDSDIYAVWMSNSDELTADRTAHDPLQRVVYPLVFCGIAVLGFLGNVLVVVVVAADRRMRCATNTLIASLSIVDLLFVVLCLPFIAVAWAKETWPFGDALCKVSYLDVSQHSRHPASNCAVKTTKCKHIYTVEVRWFIALLPAPRSASVVFAVERCLVVFLSVCQSQYYA